MNAIWVDDDKHKDYIGPTSQVEVAINQDTPVVHGREGSCRMCKNYEHQPLGGVKISYIVNGVRHDHAYKAEFDK